MRKTGGIAKGSSASEKNIAVKSGNRFSYCANVVSLGLCQPMLHNMSNHTAHLRHGAREHKQNVRPHETGGFFHNVRFVKLFIKDAIYIYILSLLVMVSLKVTVPWIYRVGRRRVFPTSNNKIHNEGRGLRRPFSQQTADTMCRLQHFHPST